MLLSMYACICANNMTPSDPIKVSRLLSKREKESWRKNAHKIFNSNVFNKNLLSKEWRKKWTHIYKQPIFFPSSFPFGKVALSVGLLPCFHSIFCMREWRKFSTFFFVFFLPATCCMQNCVWRLLSLSLHQIRHHMVCVCCVYSPYISIFLHVFKFVSIKYIIEWSGI